MDETNYFLNALSNFTTDAACGGAVRHLVDSGYTLDQIVNRLDYPAPRARVQRIMMDYLYESHVLLKKEPSEELLAPKSQLVQEQDAYGRRSFRKITTDHIGQNKLTDPSLSLSSQQRNTAETERFQWKETVYNACQDGKLTEVLFRKCKKNGELCSYVSCPFGKITDDQNSQILGCLNGRQRDYLQGIRWDQPVLYHRLDQRMIEIISKLFEAGVYEGVCFFPTEWEKMMIPGNSPAL